MSQLSHHAEVVAYRNVLREQPVPQAEDMAVADGELASGRRKCHGPAIWRENDEGPMLPSPHPDMGYDPLALSGGLNDLETKVGEGKTQPGASSHKAGQSRLGACGQLIGGHVIDVGGVEGASCQVTVSSRYAGEVLKRTLASVHSVLPR
jgi:hypothetical protein